MAFLSFGRSETILSAFIRMSDEIIDVETVAEKVVRCPKCDQRNRLYRQKKGASYRCARCRTAIPNPFSLWSRHQQSILISAAGLVVVVLAGLAGWQVYAHMKRGAGSDPQTSPVAADSVPQAPVSGSVLRAAAQAGTGSLTINDTLDCDALVKLVDETNTDSSAELLFYVQQHRTATLRGIPERRFYVLFATGGNWDPVLEMFTKDDLYFQFDRALDFVKPNTARDLALGKVGGDQPRFSPITKVDFSK
jgi:hypothetical protein